MKTPILNPGFEFVFCLSLMAILFLPPVLMAQDQKDIEIKIQNGDTTVNGRSIKDLTPVERKIALRDIKHLSGDELAPPNGEKRVFFFKKLDTGANNGHDMVRREFILKDTLRDSLRRVKRMHMMGRNQDGPSFMGRTGRPPMREPMMGPGGRNTQSLNYVTTDNDGVSTRISFRISDVTNDDLRRLPHVEGPRLEINDLNLVPEFSAGKTLLVFSLPEKNPAEIKMVNSEGKIMWSEKTSGGTFTKSFVMGLNGVYYLQIEQGKGITVKKILKEE